ncbi:MAG: hypothetical protein IKW10_08925 [Oscillospiraceae bacterium]|nr:hypothetical protein [Oscillospiraceae bacterium]
MKKILKWLIPVCVAVIAAMVGLILFLGQSDDGAGAKKTADFKLYWNVDGKPYRTGKMIRTADREGRVTITFAVDGDQVRIPVADPDLGMRIDMLQMVGLEINEEGVITDCYRVEDMGGKIIANNYLVTKVEGNAITCNSSIAATGYDVVFELDENTGVWDVGMDGITCGFPTAVKVNDQVIVCTDPDGNVDTVYVLPFQAPPPIYWNIDRKYDTTNKVCTREMDPMGGYTLQLAVNGEIVTVQTRDWELVQKMDAMAAKCFALEFDEEGALVDVIHAGTATGGGSFASWFSVDSVEGKTITCTKQSTGTSASGILGPEVLVYDVSGYGAYVGEPTDIRVGDTVHCLKDSLGRIVVVFVVNRMVDSEIYWNVERKWDSKTSLSTRTADAAGWYHIKVAVGGKQITVKTQDKAIVQAIDERAAKCFGLKLNGDVIEKVYLPTAVTGGATFASWYDITELVDRKLTCYKTTTGDIRTGTIAPGCEIYNVSTSAGTVGEVTTLQVGDRIHALKNREGQISVIFVVNRFYNYPTYYNLVRKWDTKTETTTREPDASGYYVFEMAFEGKVVTVKTKSKDIANDIDSQAAKCVALSVTNGIVTKAIHPGSTTAYKGGATSSYCLVTSASKAGFNTKKVENGKVTKTYEETYAADCKIYNVSDNYTTNKGEKTTIQVGDKVHCLKNSKGEVALVYVIQRYADLEVYYNLDRKWSDATETTTRVPDANGYYVFRMAHDGKEVQVKTKSLVVANAIDSQIAKVLGLEFGKDGLVTKAIHAGSTKTCSGGSTSSYCDVTNVTKSGFKTQKVENGKVTKTYQETFAANCKIYNVSGNFMSHQGEVTTVQVGDRVHCMKNSQGQVVIVYVITRYADLGIYYNLDRKWSDATETTTRVPNAEGFYEFRMAHEGKEVTVRTKSLVVANAIDSQIAKVLGLEFKDGLVTKAIHASSTKTCKGGIGASYVTVTAINGNKVTYTKSGVEGSFTMASNAKIFDVSSAYTVNAGEVTKLRVGDFIHCLKDSSGKTNYIFCMSRGIELIKTTHECQHVTENVTWYQWNGRTGFGGSGHYVLTQDAQLPDTVTIGADTEVTLCLNGHTLTSDVRCFKVYGTLNICDHKDAEGNYQGKIITSLSDEVDDAGNIVTKTYGGLAYLYNSVTSSVLNIYGGTFQHTGTAYAGGLVYIANNADDPRNTATFNLYDGTLTGGKATSGGAVVVSNIGQFAMYGGTITNCQAQKGGAIMVASDKAGVLIAGGSIINNTAETTGAGIQCDNGLVQISGGLIANNKATGNGGGISMEKGTLQMQGGTLDGNTAAEGGNLRITRYAEAVLTGSAKVINGSAKNGGNVTMFGKLTLMGNAQITGGQASAVSTAISVYSNYDDSVVELNVLGGTIDGSIRFTSKKGQSVTMTVLGGTVDTINITNTADATVVPALYVGGKANIQNVNLGQGQIIHVMEDLDPTASIGVSMADMSAAFAQNAKAEQASAFHPMDAEMYKVEAVEDKLYLVSVYGTHSHCACNGNAVGMGDHVCDTATVWMPWKETTSLPTTGHYYLLEDVTLSSMIELKVKADLQICLNGHTITGPGEGKRVFLLRDADLTITDCVGSGVITNAVNDTLNGGLIYQYSGGSCNDYSNSVTLYGGTLTTTGTAKAGGVLYLGNNMTKPYYATFNMYGGTITGGSSTGSGGNIVVSNKSIMNMYGGTVSNGSSNLNGGNIIVTSGCSFHVSGNAQIVNAVKGGNLYLDGVTITVGDLAETAKIGLSMSQPGEFTTITDDQDTKCFIPDDGAYEVTCVDGKLSLTPKAVEPGSGHIHCLCNGNAVGMGDHVCDAAASWTEWNNKSALPTESGYYYLTEDVTVSAMLEMKGKLDLKICLNGHTITGPGGNKRIFLLRDADLSITDCTGNGVITNAVNDTLNGGLIYQYSGSSCNKYNNSVNLYGGTLTTTGTAKAGGVLYLGNNSSANYRATFNMYGGTITGGSSTGSGGNIVVSNKCIMNMYGGTVSNGSSDLNGGNIIVTSGCSFHVSGNAQIVNAVKGGSLYLEGATITVGDLAETAKIYLSMSQPGEFATITDAEDAKCFYSTDSAYQVQNTDGKLSLAQGGAVTPPAPVGHVHCVCVGNAQGVAGHECDEDTQWEEWNNDSALPTQSGNYYLNTNVTLSGAKIELKGKIDLRICLNGHTITGPGGGERMFLLRDADLHITDCTGNGVVTNEVTSSLNGGLIYQYSGSSCNKYNNTVNLYAGTLTTTGTAKSGGVLYLGNNTSANYYATFNMYGGTVTGGTTTNSGGNIMITNACVMNMYGGTVSNGTSGLNGGNIHQANTAGLLNLVGGSVTGGTATGKGGDVYSEAQTQISADVQIGDLYPTVAAASSKSVSVLTDNMPNQAILKVFRNLLSARQ